MIKECNFKYDTYPVPTKKMCSLTKHSCKGEDKCILYQIYKQLHPKQWVSRVGGGENVLPKEPPIKTVESELCKKKFGAKNP